LLTVQESLARHPGVFNSLFVAMVKAGEVSGNLNEILEQLATYLEKLDDTRRKVKSAMNYPIFMIVFLFVMLAVMLLVIIPKFSQVYAQLGAGLPDATRKMIELSTWFGNNIGFLGFVAFLVFGVIWLISKTQRGGFSLDLLKLKTPVFGSLLEQSILNKFCKTFGILIGSGVPILESTALLQKVVNNKVYEKAIEDASNYIRDGYNISTALRRTEVFPSILLQLASTGEDTGELADLLDRAADYYQKQVDALVERMTTLIEPLLILLVGAVIAIMVVLTYLPVFHLGSALQSGL
jgi:type IV pilus assembly protein PilC